MWIHLNASCRHSCNLRPCSGTKTHIQTYKARLSRTKTQILSVHPESFCLSNLPTDTHADRQYHTKWEDYFLFMLHVVNLLTWTANRGNLPSCSCVLRETLETADCITLTFFLCDRNKPATQGEGDEAKSGKAQHFCHHHHQSLVKGHWQKLRYHLWATSLEINTATYSTSRASTKAISYSTFDTRFWQQQKTHPLISEQYELLISQPQFLLSLRLLLSSFFSSPLALTHNSFLTLLTASRSALCWGWRGWSGPDLWTWSF